MSKRMKGTQLLASPPLKYQTSSMKNQKLFCTLLMLLRAAYSYISPVVFTGWCRSPVSSFVCCCGVTVRDSAMRFCTVVAEAFRYKRIKRFFQLVVGSCHGHWLK